MKLFTKLLILQLIVLPLFGSIGIEEDSTNKSIKLSANKSNVYNINLSHDNFIYRYLLEDNSVLGYMFSKENNCMFLSKSNKNINFSPDETFHKYNSFLVDFKGSVNLKGSVASV